MASKPFVTVYRLATELLPQLVTFLAEVEAHPQYMRDVQHGRAAAGLEWTSVVKPQTALAPSLQG